MVDAPILVKWSMTLPLWHVDAVEGGGVHPIALGVLVKCWAIGFPGKVDDWTGLTGKGIALLPQKLQQNAVTALYSLFCGELPQETTKMEPPLRQATSAVVGAEARIMAADPVLVSLLRLAVSPQPARWRFLALYRILENQFLRVVLKELQEEFEEDPKTAVERAREAVQSEYKQLLRLMESYSLEVMFEELHDELAISKTRFAHAIFRASKRGGRTREKGFAKSAYGALLLYTIRCSIVHASDTRVACEKYVDSDAAIQEALGTLEKIVLMVLGIHTSKM